MRRVGHVEVEHCAFSRIGAGGALLYVYEYDRVQHEHDGDRQHEPQSHVGIVVGAGHVDIAQQSTAFSCGHNSGLLLVVCLYRRAVLLCNGSGTACVPDVNTGGLITPKFCINPCDQILSRMRLQDTCHIPWSPGEVDRGPIRAVRQASARAIPGIYPGLPWSEESRRRRLFLPDRLRPPRSR